MIEPALLDTRAEAAATETWTRRLLFAHLGRAGVKVIGPPLPAAADPRAPCPTGGCGGAPPDSALREVVFLSGTDEVEVVVARRDGGAAVSLRRFGQEGSACPDDFTLTLGYVELSAILQRLDDGALFAVLHEVALLPALGSDAVTAPLPDPERDPAAFCAGVRQVFEEDRALRRSDDRYQQAAQATLEAAFGALLAPPSPIEGAE